MIDLKNTYIENDCGKLRKLYQEECFKQGARWAASSKEFQVHTDRFIYADSDGIMLRTNLIADLPTNKITLADLKPRTKVEYVKFTGAFSELAKLFEDGELLYTAECGSHASKNMGNLLSLYEDTGIYRKVEREITWKDIISDKWSVEFDSDDGVDLNGDAFIESDFIEMCHLVSKLNK